MLGIISAAFLAGLLGSLHCVGMCGGLAASCTRTPTGLPAWHLGRIATYAMLGALAGAFGQLLPGPAWVPAALASVLLAWFALALAGMVPEPRLMPPGLASAGRRAAQSASPAAQFVFGVVNGFLPCGLVYSALTVPVAVADPVRGALAMAAFGAGTIPALSVAALGIRRLIMTSLWRRRAFALLILTTGMWTIWARASGMAHGSQPEHTMPGMTAPTAGQKSIGEDMK
jgi:sulfite exporter TauE/SafE